MLQYFFSILFGACGEPDKLENMNLTFDSNLMLRIVHAAS
jgi:hypothetical protein